MEDGIHKRNRMKESERERLIRKTTRFGVLYGQVREDRRLGNLSEIFLAAPFPNRKEVSTMEYRVTMVFKISGVITIKEAMDKVVDSVVEENIDIESVHFEPLGETKEERIEREREREWTT